MALSAHKTAPQNSTQTMRFYPFVFTSTDEGGIAAYYNYTADVQQALLKAYDAQNSSEVLPPPRKSNSYLSSRSRKSATGSLAFPLSPDTNLGSPIHDAGA